jgi:hypothetical protein
LLYRSLSALVFVLLASVFIAISFDLGRILSQML